MDKYEKLENICNIENGDVYRVQDKNTAKQYIMKRISLSQENALISPQNEMILLSIMNHPNIIQMREHFTHKNRLCLILELAAKGDLDKMIKSVRENGQSIPQIQVLDLFCQLGMAVKYLHDRKCIHRDIKSHNIFLTDSNIVKLGDFGISILLDSTSELAKTQLGTPYYISPEVSLGKDYNSKVDIWMMGCFLYELCTLKRPFSGKTWTEVEYKIQNSEPEPIQGQYEDFLKLLISQMMNKEPKERPDINSILSQKGIQAHLLAMSQNEKYKGILQFPDLKEVNEFMLESPEICQKVVSIQQEYLGKNKFNEIATTDDFKMKRISSSESGTAQCNQKQPSSSRYIPPKPRKEEEDKLAKYSLSYLLKKAQESLQQDQEKEEFMQLGGKMEVKKNRKFQQIFQEKQKEELNIKSINEQMMEEDSMQGQEDKKEENRYDKNPVESLQKSKSCMQNHEYQHSQLKQPTQSKTPQQAPPIKLTAHTKNKSSLQGSQEQSDKNTLINQQKQQEQQYQIQPQLQQQKSQQFIAQQQQQIMQQQIQSLKQLNINIPQKQSNSKHPNFKTPVTESVTTGQATSKQNNQTFNFQSLYSNSQGGNILKMPQSPNRTILFIDFLKQKLGKEKFSQMKALLESSTNPLKVLDERGSLIAEIIGIENMDCVKMFRCLITSSITPPSSHIRARSSLHSPLTQQQSVPTSSQSILSPMVNQNNSQTPVQIKSVRQIPHNGPIHTNFSWHDNLDKKQQPSSARVEHAQFGIQQSSSNSLSSSSTTKKKYGTAISKQNSNIYYESQPSNRQDSSILITATAMTAQQIKPIIKNSPQEFTNDLFLQTFSQIPPQQDLSFAFGLGDGMS